MKIISLFLIAVLSVLSCGPSADIEDYKSYFHDDQSPLEKQEFSVTYFGVSTLLFNDGETKFIIDGFFTRPSASKVLFRKLTTDKKLVNQIVRDYELQDLDAVLVNHSHYDHALDAAYLAKSTSAQLIGSPSTINLGKGASIDNKLLVLFKAGDTLAIGDFRIEVIEGKHSPPKVLNADLGEVIDEPLTQPARFSAYKEGGTFDFMITRGQTKVFVKSSPNFKADALNRYKADVAFLATGSIGTGGKDFINQYYEQTIAKLEPEILIPTHWDNFLRKDIKALKMMPYYMDRAKTTFEVLQRRTENDNTDLKILRGYHRIVLSY
ncbi:MBL fold metallo-hydrolase [Portibacter marinus]|uniref:MBL fold metallo-hydrolase n=1 Tax=Portibacter marinus TaxID=2898660 RepID=UPI001F1DF025|nr:MBL fold metallo-hydrolase [Portibacter marinus]